MNSIYAELIAVGQSLAALQALHEVVMSKRSRNTPLVSMEPIMLKYVELCVDLRKGKIVKEGLHQYKNIAQNTSVNTIEVKYYVPSSPLSKIY
jgi:translation initiation factor 3 subunit A